VIIGEIMTKEKYSENETSHIH